ncbi:sulfotransferase [Desulfohalovibrio reitneri]|uniref:sulfotransferase n=1 Tax=Desulfohalovibrio reitneri TaxID=1307759 RepID=UPI0004A73FA3|nr:sulfotransferase [Desulfohalovibrio reitneri]
MLEKQIIRKSIAYLDAKLANALGRHNRASRWLRSVYANVPNFRMRPDNDSRPLVFCLLPRSGGTMLLRLVDSHPDINTVPVTMAGFLSHTAYPDYRKDNDIVSRLDLSRFNYFGLTKEASNCAQAEVPVQFDPRWFAKALAQCQYTGNVRQYYNNVLSAFFFAWRNNVYRRKASLTAVHTTITGMEQFGTKLANFESCYKDAKLVFVSRDFYDWVNSMVNINSGFTIEKFDELHDLYLGAHEEIMRRREAMGDSLVLLQYERLVQSYDSAVHDFAQSLGLRFDSALMETTLNGIPVYQNSSFATTKLSSRPDPQSIGKGKHLKEQFQDRVDDERLERIDRFMREHSAG